MANRKVRLVGDDRLALSTRQCLDFPHLRYGHATDCHRPVLQNADKPCKFISMELLELENDRNTNVIAQCQRVRPYHNAENQIDRLEREIGDY